MTSFHLCVECGQYILPILSCSGGLCSQYALHLHRSLNHHCRLSWHLLQKVKWRQVLCHYVGCPMAYMRTQYTVRHNTMVYSLYQIAVGLNSSGSVSSDVMWSYGTLLCCLRWWLCLMYKATTTRWTIAIPISIKVPIQAVACKEEMSKGMFTNLKWKTKVTLTLEVEMLW